ncbi:MAG: hypothetical protein ACK4OO_03465 [bacterium]
MIHTHPEISPPAYEPLDAKPKRLLAIVAISAIVLVFIVVAINEFFILSKEKIYYEQVLKTENPELIRLRMKEEEILSTYGIVDSSKQIFRIPIEEAMKLLIAQRGSKGEIGD